MSDINKYTTKEVLNKVLLDSSGNAVNAYSHTSQEALNAALDDTNSRLNVNLVGGTIGGDVTINGDLTVNGDGAGAYDEIVNGDLHIKSDSGNSTNAFLVEKNDGTDVFIVDTTNSRIGINSTPSRTFQVDGTASATTATGYFYTNAIHTGVDTQSVVSIRSDNASSNGNVLHVQGDGTGNLLTLSKDGSDKLTVTHEGNVGIGVVPTHNLNIYNGSGSSNMTVGKYASGKTVALLATSADTSGYFQIQSYASQGTTFGNIVLNAQGGNVGIGTTAPERKLHVVGNPILIDNNQHYEGKDSGGAKRRVIGLDSSNNINIGSGQSGGSINFIEGDTTHMSIDASGNVGIGTASPTTKLTVLGSMDDNIIKFGAGSAQNIALGVTNDRDATRVDFFLATEYGAESWSKRVTVTNQGKVGIGTTSPSGILSIFRNDSSTVGTNDVVIENDGNGDASLKFSLTGATDWYAYVDNSDSDKFKIRRSTTDHLSIDESGNATFAGDITTNERLIFGGTNDSIVASAITPHSNGFIYIAGGSGGLVIGDDATSSRIQIMNDAEIKFEVNGSEKMRIEDSGNINIGSSSSKTNNIGSSARGITIANAIAPVLSLWDTTNAGYHSHFFQVENNATLRSSGNLIFQTNAANTALTIDSSQNSTFAGNVQVKNSGFVFSAGAITIQSGSSTNVVLDAGAGADEFTLSDSALNITVPTTFGGNVTSNGNILSQGASAPSISVLDTTNNASIQMRALDTEVRFGSTSNHPVKIGTNNTYDALILGTDKSATFGGDITVSSATDTKPILKLEQTGNNVNGGQFIFLTSGTANDNDLSGVIRFKGMNDAGTPEEIEYATIYAKNTDVSDGSEDGELHFRTMSAGSLDSRLTLSSSNATFAGSVMINSSSANYADLTVGGTGDIVALRASSGTAGFTMYEAGTGRFNMTTLNGSGGIAFKVPTTTALTINSSATSTFTNSGGASVELATSSNGTYAVRSGYPAKFSHYYFNGTSGSIYKNDGTQFLSFNSDKRATFYGHIFLPSTGTSTPTNHYIVTDNTSAGTGSLTLQAGEGSAGYGGGLKLYSHSHATYGGWVTAGISANSGGKFSVNTYGVGTGTNVFTVDASGNGTFSGDVRLPNSGKLYLWNDNSSNYLRYNNWQASASSGMTIANTSGSGSIILKSGNSTALTLDSSQNATFTGSINTQDITAYNMITIESADISNGENNGLRLINTSGTDHYWHITNGQTGVSNENFTIRDGTNNRDIVVLETSSGNATFYNRIILGGGITFPASQNASSNANTLDDYEEGDYAGAIGCGSSGSVTIDSSVNNLQYTKIGRVVHVIGQLNVSSVSSPSGFFVVTVPFAIGDLSESGGRTSGSITVTGVTSANVSDFIVLGVEGETSMRVYLGDGTSPVADSANQLQAGATVRVNFTYYV